MWPEGPVAVSHACRCPSPWPAGRGIQIRPQTRVGQVGYTDFAKQMPSKDMLYCEDLSPLSVPSITDPNMAVVQGAYKYEQIGPDAAAKVAEAIFGDMDLPDRGITTWVDMNPAVGCFFHGWLAQVMTQRHTMLYVNICPSDIISEWMRAVKKDTVSELFAAGTLTVPGLSPMPTEMPSDLLESEPEPPQLKLCAWVANPNAAEGRLCKKALNMPAPVFQTWHDHDTYGVEFRALLEKCQEARVRHKFHRTLTYRMSNHLCHRCWKQARHMLPHRPWGSSSRRATSPSLQPAPTQRPRHLRARHSRRPPRSARRQAGKPAHHLRSVW